MNNVLKLMAEWQKQHDEPVDLFNRNQVKFFIEYDRWDDRFFIESNVGYIGFGVVYFSSKKMAQAFLEQHEKDLRSFIQTLKQKHKR